MAVKKIKLIVLLVVLSGCIFGGTMAAGVRPALAALSSLAGETCSASWVTERGRGQIMLNLKLDCSALMRFRAINRLYLTPVDRKW